MLDTLTVWSSAAFADGRQLPRASRWVPTAGGFAFEAPHWRIDVRTSAAVAPADVPVEVRDARPSACFRTDVTLAPESAPPAAREFFEWAARSVAVATNGIVAIDAPEAAEPGGVAEPLAPTRSREKRAFIVAPRALDARDVASVSARDLTWLKRFTAWKLLAYAVFGGAFVIAGWTVFGTPPSGRHASQVARADRIAFDSAGWRAGDQTVRARMVDDLIERRSLLGLSLDEVTQWLGSPFDPHAAGSPELEQRLSAWDVAFRAGSIGYVAANATDPAYVVVRLDKTAQVVAADVVWP